MPDEPPAFAAGWFENRSPIFITTDPPQEPGLAKSSGDDPPRPEAANPDIMRWADDGGQNLP
jgi:hypothetical protein